MSVDDRFIKKLWKEEDILFLVHFKDGRAVRQIEIKDGAVTCIDTLGENSRLADQPLNEFDLTIEDFVSKATFEQYWARCARLIRRGK